MTAGACRRAERPSASGETRQRSGTIEIDGLSRTVRVVRDRWGVPHIYAESRDDLFLAQGFVQAQDRLFQMDLWRRSGQGRLAEVLGASFIERDAMTRRIQYRGDPAVEWESYGPEARAIAAAFVRGINACVAMARRSRPEEFVLAGWTPDSWTPEDLLNRTEGFTSSNGAIEQVARRHFSVVVAEAIRRIGARPYFAGLSAVVRLQADHPTADHELVSPAAAFPVTPSGARVENGALRVEESPQRFEQPSLRYLVHLKAPGWNVIGATAPWRPGVAIGHNEQLAWGPVPIDADLQDVFESPVNPQTTRVIKDAIVVKGRNEPFLFDIELTPRGVVVAADRTRNLVYTVQWAGFDPGTAPEMAALAIDTTQSLDEFRSASARWKMPARRLVALDRNGQHGQDARDGQNKRQGRDGSARVVFASVLAITDPARARFNVGPLDRPERDSPLRAVLVPQAWDESKAINAPGQSESPDDRRFADLASPWSAGELVPLPFTDAAVDANADQTLLLVPRRRSP